MIVQVVFPLLEARERERAFLAAERLLLRAAGAGVARRRALRRRRRAVGDVRLVGVVLHAVVHVVVAADAHAALLVLVAVVALVTYQLVIALEHRHTALTLVVQTWRAVELGVVISRAAAAIWRIVLVALARLLAGVLEPDDDDARTQTEHLRQVVKVVVLGVGVAVEVVLQDAQLVV